jgi:CheY-like chemotaxis protein
MKKILVVDNDKLILEFARNLIEKERHEVLDSCHVGSYDRRKGRC